MKILFTVLTYYPEMGGVSVVTKYLAEGLSKLGHQVSIVTTLLEGTQRKEILNGVNIYRFKLYDKKITGYDGEIDEYIKFIKGFKCDIIINEATQCVTTDLLLPILKELKPKKVLHIHGFSGLSLKFYQNIGTLKNKIGNMYNYIKWKLYYKDFYKYLYDYDKILCLSKVDNGKKYMEKHTNIKPEILENAAEEMFFRDNNARQDVLGQYIENREKPYLISVANYVPIKNQELLLKMFYSSKIDNCALVLIGKEKTYYYNKLIKLKKKLEKRYGKKDVSLLVDVNRKDIPILIANSKVYLVSSISEQYSVSIIEAMASKVPFISRDVGNASILPGGKIANTIPEMEREINKFLKDESYRKSVGQKGYEYAYNHCRIEHAINKLNNILKNL